MAKPETCRDCQVFFIQEGSSYGECRLNPPMAGSPLERARYPEWSPKTKACSCGLKTVQKKAKRRGGAARNTEG